MSAAPETLIASLTPAELASFLAARAIAAATAYLGGRSDAARFSHDASQLMGEMLAVSIEPGLSPLLDPTRILIVAMTRTAAAHGVARQDRWQQVIGALVELVRHENAALRNSGAS